MTDGMQHGVFRPPQKAERITIYVGEAHRWHGVPVYEAVVMKARELHMAGATVMRGPMGFGATSRVHTAKILRLSTDLPVVIEIIDTAEKIATLLPHLEQMITGGLVTREEVGVALYAPSGKPA